MTPAPEPEPTVLRELVLTGPPLRLALPDVCARCGSQAAKKLYWQKVIGNDSGEGHSNEVIGSRAPFCARCLEQHEREIRRMPVWKQALQMFRSQSMIPAAITGGMALFIALGMMPNLLTADRTELLVFAGAIGFLSVIALGSLVSAWRNTRHYCVPPLTAITGSFTFGPDESEMFEGERHRYTIVNDVYFEALLSSNRDKIWKPGSARGLRASWMRKILYVLGGVAAAVILLWDWIQPWVRVEW